MTLGLGLAPFCTLAFLRLVLAQQVQLIYGLQDQRPAVARVGEAWTFQLLPGTFHASTASDLTYSTSSLPNWASFNAQTQTFSGQPTSSDVGSTYVFVHASAPNSQSAQDAFHLLVSSDSVPYVNISFATQLANGASTQPAGSILVYDGSLRIPPWWSFSIGFQQYSFQDASFSRIYYTAYSSGTTSIPSWLTFENDTMTFDGVAPASGVYPITVYGSDHYGYGDIHQSFILRIDAHQFDLLVALPVINASVSAAIEYVVPTSGLRLDGNPLNASALTSTAVDVSNFTGLSYNSVSRTISGQMPANVNSAAIPVVFTSIYGETLSTTIGTTLSTTLFTQFMLPTLILAAGSSFSYNIGQYTGDTAATYSAVITPTAAAKWMSFDASKLVLFGTAPNPIPGYNVSIALSASDAAKGTSSSAVLLAAFDLDMSPSTSEAASSTLASATGVLHGSASHKGLSSEAKLAIALSFGSFGGVALLVALFSCCRRCVAPEGEDESKAIGEPANGYEEPHSAFTKAEKGKTKAEALEDRDLAVMTAIYGGVGDHQMPSQASLQQPAPAAKRFDLLRVFGSGSRHSDLAQAASSPNVRGMGISEPMPSSRSQPDELDTSSWGSQGSSSLFYSDTESPQGKRSSTPRSKPRQRRDFMPIPGMPSPLPYGAPPSPSPVPSGGVRIVPSQSQASGTLSENASRSSMMLRLPTQPPAAAGPSLLERRAISAATRTVTPYVDLPRPTARARLIPFTSERVGALPPVLPRPQAVSQKVEQDAINQDAVEDANEESNGQRASVPYVPPQADDGEAVARSPIFFSTPRENFGDENDEPWLIEGTPQVGGGIRVVSNPREQSPTRRGRGNPSASLVDQVRVLVGVGTPFHFTPTLNPPPSAHIASPGRNGPPRVTYLAVTDTPDDPANDKKPLPDWLHFAEREIEFWGIPREEDAGSLPVQIIALKSLRTPGSPHRQHHRGPSVHSHASTVSSVSEDGDGSETCVGRFVLDIRDRRASQMAPAEFKVVQF